MKSGKLKLMDFLPYKKTILISAIIITCVMILSFVSNKMDTIPRVWDMEKLKSQYLPLADRSNEVSHIPEDLYYKIPERIAYKTYPLYLPGREPKGYYEWLLKQEPQIIFDASTLKSEADWIKAGEIIYDMPQDFEPFMDSVGDIKELIHIAEMVSAVHVPVTKDGSIPFFQLAIRTKGKIEKGTLACSNCHNRVMPDGSLLKGGQGNHPFNAAVIYDVTSKMQQSKVPDSVARAITSSVFRVLYGAPWIRHESQEFIKNPDPKKVTALTMATVPGVMQRHGTVYSAPIVIPDLFNIKVRKYFDRTGALRHRDISDLMRYATLNQQMDFTNSYGGFKPDPSPDSILIKRYTRFSDAQAYALAKYIYSLKPLPNPKKAAPELIARGKVLFEEEGCDNCHTPPLYTNNRLTPAWGFTLSKEDKTNVDIMELCVKTDPTLALYTRRGTGYYKIPSLIGVWNRGALLHGGYVTSLEEMFNPARHKDDFMPSGFNPNIDKPFPVKGHSFGLGLSEEDKKALIAFLRSL